MSAERDLGRLRLEARKLEARLRVIGTPCPDGTLEPLEFRARKSRIAEPLDGRGKVLRRPNSGYVIGVR